MAKYLERNKYIQREQQKLLKLQKHIDTIITEVNESINALKVEELQLKSNAVSETISTNQPEEHLYRCKRVYSENISNVDPPSESFDDVNEQTIDINIPESDKLEFIYEDDDE